MRFLRPDLASWLLVAPAIIVCWSVHAWYRARHGRPVRSWALLVCALLAVALASLAMMRPQLATTMRQPAYERRDLIVLLDRSVSMRARDVAPSRAARAVAEIQQFLRDKPDTIDRVGLIGFAEAAVVLSYPTADVDSLAFYLDWAQADEALLFGTNIGGALEAGLTLARRERRTAPPIFVLISDGEDQTGRAMTAAAQLAEAGIRVYAIGLGSDRRVPMPVPAGDGREEPLRDDNGELLTTQFSGRTLEQVAARTGGMYFRSTRGGELMTALADVARDARRQVGWTTVAGHRDLYRPLLAGAALALLGVVLLL